MTFVSRACVQVGGYAGDDTLTYAVEYLIGRPASNIVVQAFLVLGRFSKTWSQRSFVVCTTGIEVVVRSEMNVCLWMAAFIAEIGSWSVSLKAGRVFGVSRCDGLRRNYTFVEPQEERRKAYSL